MRAFVLSCDLRQSKGPSLKAKFEVLLIKFATSYLTESVRLGQEAQEWEGERHWVVRGPVRQVFGWPRDTFLGMASLPTPRPDIFVGEKHSGCFPLRTILNSVRIALPPAEWCPTTQGNQQRVCITVWAKMFQSVATFRPSDCRWSG